MFKEGEIATNFCLRGIDENGIEKELCLKDFRGKNVVVYFYPKDNTPGCTKEACAFRDNISVALSEDAVVLGISADSIESHKRFKEKFGLNFPLLSDSEKKVMKEYDAFGEKKMFGKTTMGTIRSTFIIDKTGRIKKIWRNVKVEGHVDQVLRVIQD